MKRKRILVVDDDPTLRSALQSCLECNGHTVETAENGREALTKLGHAVYDVLLLDYMMPDVGGLAVLRHVQQHHPAVPVVMMTGERSSQLAAESFMVLGARACLFKPFATQDFEQILTTAMLSPRATPAA